MDKYDIFEKNLEDSILADERDHKIQGEASTWAMMTMLIVAICLFIFNILMGQENGDIMSLPFFGISAMMFMTFRKTRWRGHMGAAIVMLISGLIFLTTYVLRILGIL